MVKLKTLSKLFCLFVLIYSSKAMVLTPHEQEIFERIRPLGNVYTQKGVQNPVEEKETQVVRDAATIYKTFCISCHASGVAGAPKTGDKKEWEKRLNKGVNQLTLNAIKGYNAMPAKGTCMDCTDDEIKKTVSYMLESLN